MCGSTSLLSEYQSLQLDIYHEITFICAVDFRAKCSYWRFVSSKVFASVIVCDKVILNYGYLFHNLLKICARVWAQIANN